jgi:hypothetical protein
MRFVLVPALPSQAWKFAEAFSPGAPMIPMLSVWHFSSVAGAASDAPKDGGWFSLGAAAGKPVFGSIGSPEGELAVHAERVSKVANPFKDSRLIAPPS